MRLALREFLEFITHRPYSCSVSTTSLENALYVLAGVPLDVTSIGRRGAGEAPVTVRKAIHEMETYELSMDIDLEDVPLYDAGDIDVGTDVRRAIARVAEFVKYVVLERKHPVLVGGEHTITLGAIEGLVDRFGRVAVVIFDAHLDLRDEYPVDCKYTHATVTRRICEIVGPENVIVVGAHAFSREEVVWARREGVAIVSNPSSPKLEEQLARLKGLVTHLSIDIDVLDPALVPGVSYPEPGGLTLNQLVTGIRRVVSLANVVSIDLVELLPPCDPTGISPFYAAKVLLAAIYAHYIAKYSKRDSVTLINS